MKYRILFFGLIFTFSCVGVYAIENTKVDSIAKQLFVKSEKVAIRDRTKIMKNRFLDPIGNNELFFKIVARDAPDLLNNTNRYKFSILKLLTDTTFEKDYYTESDIINLLSNLCIDNYIEIIDSVKISVRNGVLNFKILENVVFQDFNVSNQVARNYKNQYLQQLLHQLKLDIESGEIIIPKGNYTFVTELDKLISGKTWENELKNDEQLSPPLLNPKNCK